MSNVTADGILSASEKFNWIEYTTFSTLLGLSAVIGIYYGCFKGNQNTVNEYMLGGKHMSVFPIAMSLIASHISGITLLGIPSEIYEFGTQYFISCLSVIVIVLVTNTFYLPVFYDLQLYSIYEYLELRFSRHVRLLASFIFLINMMLYVPVVIYIPALAFHQVTGTSVHIITPIICSLCIFYTTIGGLKAVVWTDAIQSIFTLGSVIVIIILGVIDVGGLQKVFEINERGQRLEFFNPDPNLYSRTTFWSIFLGVATMWTVGLTVHPGSTQRFIALPSKRAAMKSVLWFGLGVIVIVSLSGFVGLIMYAKYWNCDPMASQHMKSSGKLLPYYVQEVATSFPGLTGLFISGLVSAALSTMSAGLNTLAGTFYEDFVTLCLPKKVSDFTASCIMKISVLIFGGICVALVYIVEKLGPIVQMSYTLSGAPNGAMFSAFALGIFFPWANWKGVIVGMITSVLLTGWIATGAQLALINNDLIFVGKPLNTSGCLANITAKTHPSQIPRFEEIGQGVFADKNLFFMYKFAFMYFTPIGGLIGIVVGLIVSICTGGNDLKNINPNLITPMMRKFLPKNESAAKKYDPVPQELEIMRN